jgi:hypothetical protein
MMTEPGAYFNDEEANHLHDYLVRGGFLWADDFWGEYAWTHWEHEIRKVLPSGEFPLRDLPLDHPIFHVLYDVKELPQIPSIDFWLGTGGRTSERGADSAVPHARHHRCAGPHARLHDAQHRLRRCVRTRGRRQPLLRRLPRPDTPSASMSSLRPDALTHPDPSNRPQRFGADHAYPRW